MIELVEATPGHFPRIRDIACLTWPSTFGAILSEKQIAYMLELMYSLPALEKQVGELGHRFILAREGETYLGYASYEINFEGKPKTKLHKVYLLPESQGKGVGRALLDRVGVAAQAAGDSVVSLNVNRYNPATQFYEKLGFQIVGQVDIDIGNGFLMEDFILEKRVEPS